MMPIMSMPMLAPNQDLHGADNERWNHTLSYVNGRDQKAFGALESVDATQEPGMIDGKDENTPKLASQWIC